VTNKAGTLKVRVIATISVQPLCKYCTVENKKLKVNIAVKNGNALGGKI